MSKDTARQIANALSVVIALAVNILASTLPLNGQNTGEISDRFLVYFVAAGARPQFPKLRFFFGQSGRVGRWPMHDIEAASP